MCGIAGIHRTGTKPVPKINELADALLLEIEARGTHATGLLAMMHDGKVLLEKKVIPASRFVKGRARIRPSAKTVLLHTRFATVGRREDPRNAHPTGAGTVASIHNGTIYNADALFAEHQLDRIGTVDSEIVPALINHLGWHKAEHALKQLRGGAALGICSAENTDEVILARTQSYPLVYMVTEGLVVWASTQQAIERAWRKVYGRKPMGEFKTLPDWTMARVNGKVTITKIPVPKGERDFYRRPRPLQATNTVPKRVRKATRKRGYSRSSTPGVPTPQRRDFDVGYIHGPHGMEYVGIAQAASFEAMLDAGVPVAEAYDFVTEELEDWAVDESRWEEEDGFYQHGSVRRSGRGVVYTDSQAWLAARERGEV